MDDAERNDSEPESGNSNSNSPTSGRGKSALNKTKTGRVTKATDGAKKSGKIVFYDEYDDSEGEDAAAQLNGGGADLMVSDGDEFVDEYVPDEELAIKSEGANGDAHGDDEEMVEVQVGGEASVFS